MQRIRYLELRCRGCARAVCGMIGLGASNGRCGWKSHGTDDCGARHSFARATASSTEWKPRVDDGISTCGQSHAASGRPRMWNDSPLGVLYFVTHSRNAIQSRLVFLFPRLPLSMTMSSARPYE